MGKLGLHEVIDEELSRIYKSYEPFCIDNFEPTNQEFYAPTQSVSCDPSELVSQLVNQVPTQNMPTTSSKNHLQNKNLNSATQSQRCTTTPSENNDQLDTTLNSSRVKKRKMDASILAEIEKEISNEM